MLEINEIALEGALKNFHKITKLKVTLYDKDRNILFSYPSENHEFCSIVGECAELKKQCLRCDARAMDFSCQTEKARVYTCHMNLLKAINPIRMGNELAGFMILGQKIEESNENAVKKRVFEVSKKFEIDGNRLLSEMEKFDKVDVDTMEAAANVMMMCTSRLYRHRLIVKRGDDVPAYKIGEYLYENINGDLSVPAMCKYFHVSKSKLYSISKKAFGMGVSEYVRKMRIEEGKKALKYTTKNINQIAEDIGFSDANYFIRVFRKEEGMTPSKYRKMMQKEEK